jgi:F-type H+-transporting ATPase subunit b
MHIDWWTLALQTINLLVLVWILSRYLFRPIADIIRKRQAAADALLEKAEADCARAEEEEQKAQHDTEEAEKARASVLKKAAKEAEAEKAQILSGAREEADSLRAAVKAEVDKLREAEQAKTNRQASALAVDIARKLFDRLPDSAKIDGFIEGLADAVAKLPDGARNEIGADGGAVAVVSARKMSDSEVADCRDALSGALGRDVTVNTKADPALIAGLEIETPHAAVRNSFRADLERVAAELAGRDEA